MKKILTVGAGILTLAVLVGIAGNVFTLNTVDAKTSNKKPSQLTARIIQGDVHLSWQDNSNDESSFWIMRAEDSSGDNWNLVGKAPVNTEQYTDTTPTAGKTYYYRVRSVTEHGGSKAWSNMIKVNVGANTNTFYTPGSLQARQNSTANLPKGSVVDLTWKDNSAENSGYVVERKENGGSYTILTKVGGNASSFRDKNVSKGDQYTYRVRAYGTKSSKTVYSNYSNTSSVTVR